MSTGEEEFEDPENEDDQEYNSGTGYRQQRSTKLKNFDHSTLRRPTKTGSRSRTRTRNLSGPSTPCRSQAKELAR